MATQVPEITFKTRVRDASLRGDNPGQEHLNPLD